MQPRGGVFWSGISGKAEVRAGGGEVVSSALLSRRVGQRHTQSLRRWRATHDDRLAGSPRCCRRKWPRCFPRRTPLGELPRWLLAQRPGRQRICSLDFHGDWGANTCPTNLASGGELHHGSDGRPSPNNGRDFLKRAWLLAQAASAVSWKRQPGRRLGVNVHIDRGTSRLLGLSRC